MLAAHHSCYQALKPWLQMSGQPVFLLSAPPPHYGLCLIVGQASSSQPIGLLCLAHPTSSLGWLRVKGNPGLLLLNLSRGCIYYLIRHGASLPPRKVLLHPRVCIQCCLSPLRVVAGCLDPQGSFQPGQIPLSIPQGSQRPACLSSPYDGQWEHGLRRLNCQQLASISPDSALLLPFLSLVFPPNLILPGFWSVSFFINPVRE